jgi:hypothetical protein
MASQRTHGPSSIPPNDVISDVAPANIGAWTVAAMPGSAVPPAIRVKQPNSGEPVTGELPETAVPDEPPIRVMALHALLYCDRLFYLEEIEEIRVADAAVYAVAGCMTTSSPWTTKPPNTVRSRYRARRGGSSARSTPCAVATASGSRTSTSGAVVAAMTTIGRRRGPRTESRRSPTPCSWRKKSASRWRKRGFGITPTTSLRSSKSTTMQFAT